jgi:hypothetical protein
MENKTSNTVSDDIRGHEETSNGFLDITNGRPVFRSGASGATLWDIYLGSFPESVRQHYNCNACKSFIRRYGGLVYIDDDLEVKSAVWDPDKVATPYKTAVSRLRAQVEARPVKITGLFYSTEHILGTPEAGGWNHFFAEVGKRARVRSMLKKPHEREAEKLQDFITVSRALDAFKIDHVRQALSLLRSDSMHRGEKALGVAEAFYGLHEKVEAARHFKKQFVWLYVADNPDGFCHIKSSVIGTLLEDIASGDFDGDAIARRFRDKMDATKYQRPQSAPSDGNIDQAEKIFESMGLAPSLKRRFARFEEVPTFWKPRDSVRKTETGDGVFGHLRNHFGPVVESPEKRVTWRWFNEKVLPDALSIELDLRGMGKGNFSALLTAVDADAPCLFQWGNHFSQYVYAGGSSAYHWNLRTERVKVAGICHAPHQWDDATPQKNHHDFDLLILEGCKDTLNRGLAIFPETLIGEVHGVRKTIEAFSNRGKLEGFEEASACGLKIHGGESGAKIRVFVTTELGVNRYMIDMWE